MSAPASTSVREMATAATTDRTAAPLIVHIVHRLGIGGLENGLVNLINHLPATQYRHAIICLTEATDFRRRIRNMDVEVHALGKRAGKDFGAYWRLWRLLRELRPDVVHTRNLATVDCQFVAALAGVRGRVHGEHGWDVYDLHGTNSRYRWLRRAVARIVSRFVTMSRDLERWLVEDIGVPAERITQIYSGVDAGRFHPCRGPRGPFGPAGFSDDHSFIVGTAGRLEAVKDPLTLLRAFIELVTRQPQLRERIRLVFIGDGALRGEMEREIAAAGVAPLCWLPGSRDDVPALLRGLDLFVLPSLNEGISNTILEAMASALPVVATRVGGNVELVREGETGALCPVRDPQAMAAALLGYATQPELAQRHGAAARVVVERDFALARMVQDYVSVYERVLAPVRLDGER
ncbi:MAG TPA: TIGR03088 family PEP-CTERM/XrtA system glycosyltransferase [Steroidobacteraceae bacterium]|nr:TIGR03088 family PEP-CTERM/XrtA system glycosyltransferase [Steroidobacteraceae bacterium]